MRKSIFLVFLFVSLLGFSQKKQKYSYVEKPLELVLKQLQETSDISFSFANEYIVGKTISVKTEEITLDDFLKIIQKQTGLKFQKINDKEYILIPPPTEKKVCGILLDKDTKEPIAFATIQFSTNKEAYTDENGAFAIIANSNEKITAKSFGYDAKEIPNCNDCCTIELQSSSENLEEIVVQAYVTTGIDRKKDGSIQLTSKKLGVLPGLLNTDISQSIQLIPGVTSLDESATGIQIRGGSPDQNLILYDHIKLYNTGYFYGMFSLFNPFATESATIFRSGTSAAYGDRISGIIDISSGNKIPSKTEGGFEIDGLAANGYLKTPLSKKVALYVFARRSYSDIFETPTYDSYATKIFTNFGVARDINGNILNLETDDDFNPETSHHEFSFADINSKIVFKPNSKNTISISGLYTRNVLDFGFGEGQEEELVDSLITQNKGLSFHWKHKTDEKHHEEITAYYSEYNSFYRNDELKDETNDGKVDLSEINIRENNIVDFGLNLSTTTQINKKQKLTFGYQFSNTDLKIGISKEKPFDNESSSSPQRTKNLKNAAYGEYTFALKKKGLIKSGIRFVHYGSVGEIKLEPRVNFEYALTNRLRFKTAVERRNQPISQLVEFNHTELRLENNLWRLSDNGDFPLLSSNQISGGFLYKNNNLTIDIDTYYKELKGLTTFTSGFSNPFENLEEGTSTIKGTDVLVKYKYNNYKVWAGYTFNDIDFRFPNLNNTNEEFPGNNDIRHQFRISNSYNYKNWQFSLGWQFRNGRPTTPVNSYVIKKDSEGENAGVVNFGAINSGRLDNYHRLDGSILYNFHITSGAKKLKSQLGLSILNLYNRVRPINIVHKAEVKPLDDGGIAKTDGSGNELILEQVIQRFSLGFTPNISWKVFF